jgi:hypothetical protein
MLTLTLSLILFFSILRVREREIIFGLRLGRAGVIRHH